MKAQLQYIFIQDEVKETYLKAQKCSKFHRPHVRIACSRKREFFPKRVAVILSAVALPIVLKGEFNFELILYITIFVF